MERQAIGRLQDEPANPLILRLAGFVSLLGLLAWQGWLTLFLFAADKPWEKLLDDQPIVSGSHPLHLYHGYLGAQAIVEQGTTCCYDPRFQSGYPKTPIFDSGSRPAELFLLAGGAQYRPAAYKVGLAITCLLAPLFFVIGARGLGLGWLSASLAGWLGMVVWWGRPCHEALERGDLDLLLASLAILAQIGMLVRFDRAPGLWAWLGLLFSGSIAWLADPLLAMLLAPIVLVYYLSVGARHRLFWHGALFVGLLGAVAVNTYWLVDWVTHWWIRNPLHASAFVLPHRTFATLWRAALWGDSEDRALCVALFGLAVVGVYLLNSRRERPAARLLGLGGAGMLLLAIAGIAYEPLARMGASNLLIPGLFLMTLPAIYVIRDVLELLGKWARALPKTAALVGLLIVAGGHALRDEAGPWLRHYYRIPSLEIGLSPERQALIETLQAHTTNQARILWEDRTDQASASHWTALLPLLTDRVFLGGLDPEAGIEHANIGLSDYTLGDKLLLEWKDSKDWTEYCKRYNVGWVVCSSSAVRGWLEAWKEGVAPIACLDPNANLWLYEIKRDSHSFILKGQAEWLSADSERIVLRNVVPDKGEVILSLHYQAELRASPSSVKIEEQKDPLDPIPFIRLRLTGPTTCITLTWDSH